MPYITGRDRMQLTMLPESIDDYVSEENEVRVIDAFVEALDMKELGFVRYEAANTGRPGFRPQDMLKVYIYGFLNRIRSSRRLEQECKRNVELMWLLNKLTPDYKTIADFRRDNSKALKQVFRQFTVICREWDLFSKEIVAVDGSKFKASNSKRNNYSDKKLARQIRYINGKIDEYIQILENTDEEEINVRKPKPEEIEKRIKELSERKKKYEDMKIQIAGSEENELSTIDPDARLMYSNNNGVDVSYNVQATVDIKHNLVADIEVINNASDSGQLYPMAERAKEILEVEKIEVTAKNIRI
jgi:transposase